MGKELALRIGDIGLDKGYVREGIPLVAWDSVQTCFKKCPITLKCPHFHINKKCEVQVDYLTRVCQSIFGRYKYMDSRSLFKFGMHVIPLYSQLCRLKIIELGVKDLELSAKGKIYIHPVYREIRETLKMIVLICKDLELYIDGKVPMPGINEEGDANGWGDPNYYEEISKKRVKA